MDFLQSLFGFVLVSHIRLQSFFVCFALPFSCTLHVRSLLVPNTIWATVLYRIYNVEPQARHFISDTIRARILYCTYEMKSTIYLLPRREFAHFSIRYNRGPNIVSCLWNEKHALICSPEGNSHILVSGTIEVRILYRAYEMKSTLTFVRRREFPRDELITEF